MLKFLVGFAVFLAWAAWARQVYVCEIRQLCGSDVFANNPPRAMLGLRISRTGEVLSGRGQFLFTVASSSTAFTPANRAFLVRLRGYLAAGLGLRLRVAGRYARSEQSVPAGMYENLGLARAALIRDSLVGRYGVPPAQVAIEAELLDDDDTEAATAPNEPLGFWLVSGKQPPPARHAFADMDFAEHHFKQGGGVFAPRLPFIRYTDSLVVHLQQHPEQSVLITVYGAGLQAQRRADAVRRYLVRTRGVAAPVLTATRNQSRKHPLNLRVVPGT